MSVSLVECIPNFSEARRPEVVETILKAIATGTGVVLLDHSSDLDHNRTVVTYIGSPQAVEEATFRGIAKAAELIDLNQHTGEHPRIGACDVAPFVPIQGVSMTDCVEIARRLGRRVGEELKIPVYLYEEAATRPERVNLANIRRGEFETLKEEMGSNPARDPDFGPASIGPAGATVIGARAPLVAFNVYLTTDDASIAKKIAKAVRHSSGGLRFVKALGMLVEGRAQVSMNLTNFHKTPIARVVEFIRREAARYGVSVHHSELIGLIPQAALVEAAQWYLQLDGFQPNQVLEQRMAALMQAGTAVHVVEKQPTFLDQLAAGTPTPGGGSAAANAAAAGAALTAMVARLTVGKKKYQNVQSQMWAIIEQADALREQLVAAVDEDAAAFEQVMAAFKLPKSSPEEIAERHQRIEGATAGAAQVPLRVVELAVQVMALAVQAAAQGNTNAITDAGTAAALAQAGLTGAALNVRINLQSLQNRQQVDAWLNDLQILEDQAARYQAEIRSSLQERGNLKY